MSRHHKLEQPVQQLLKKFLQQACEAQALEGSGNGCRWLANISAVSRGPTLQDLEQGLLKAVRYACRATSKEFVSGQMPEILCRKLSLCGNTLP